MKFLSVVYDCIDGMAASTALGKFIPLNIKFFVMQSWLWVAKLFLYSVKNLTIFLSHNNIVSHKKLMLLRWERSVLDKTSLPLSPPPSPHSPHPHPPMANEDKQPIKRRNSPLFEELSDEEFEETRKTADSADGEKTTRKLMTTTLAHS